MFEDKEICGNGENSYVHLRKAGEPTAQNMVTRTTDISDDYTVIA